MVVGNSGVAPMTTYTMAAAAPTMPMVTLTIYFVSSLTAIDGHDRQFLTSFFGN